MSHLEKLAESLQAVDVGFDQAERLIGAYVDGVFGALYEKQASLDTQVAVLSSILLRADPELEGHIKLAGGPQFSLGVNPLSAMPAGPDNPVEMLKQNPGLAQSAAYQQAREQHPFSADPHNPTANEQLIDAGHARGASGAAPTAAPVAPPPGQAQARMDMAEGHGAGAVGRGLAYAGGAAQSAQNFASPYLDRVKAFLARNGGRMGQSIGGGAALGGLGSLLYSGLSANEGNRKHWFRNALLSALAGGGAGYLFNRMASGAGSGAGAVPLQAAP